MRDSGWISTAPNFAKSTCGTFGRPAPAGVAGADSQQALDVRLDVVGRDPALRPGARDAAQIDAEFARELAHRRARMRSRETRLVDAAAAATGDAGAGAGGLASTRGSGGACSRCGSRRGCGRRGARRGRRWGCGRGGRGRRRSSSRITRALRHLVAALQRASARCGPRPGDGTSIVAFSVSSVISGVSLSICWPALTSTSMTLNVLEAADVGYPNLRWEWPRCAPRPSADSAFRGRCRTSASPGRPSSRRSCRRRRAP